MYPKSKFYRMAAMAQLAIWAVLMFLPVSVYAIEGFELRPEQVTADMLAYESGWERALFGWIRVFEGNFAWFANLFAIWAAYDMLRGLQPKAIAAFAAPLLAATGLTPYSLGDILDTHGTNGPTTMYFTVDVWAWSCAIPLASWALVWGLRIADTNETEEPDSKVEQSDF